MDIDVQFVLWTQRDSANWVFQPHPLLAAGGAAMTGNARFRQQHRCSVAEKGNRIPARERLQSMFKEHRRMTRERRTVEAMIDLYCHGLHGSTNGRCVNCEALYSYARQRLQKCPFQEGKTTCAKCPLHCYRPEMRQQIRTVMRYAGPRMLYRHPVLALQHLVDGLRAKPLRAHAVGARPPADGREAEV
jgi:hypothetical protein